MADKVTMQIGGMTCVRCAAAVEHALKADDGVLNAQVSYANERAEVEYEPSRTNMRRLSKAVKRRAIRWWRTRRPSERRNPAA